MGKSPVALLILLSGTVCGMSIPAAADSPVFRYRAAEVSPDASQGTAGGGGSAGGSQTGAGTTPPGTGATAPGGGTSGPDTTPSAISFESNLNAPPASQALSAIRQLTDHVGVDLSVSGGSSASLRVCADLACNSPTTGWVSSAPAATDAYVQLRQVAPDFGQTAVATLSYGTLSATWQVDSAPFASCPGDFMRMKVSTGFEALVCGFRSAPPNVVADIRSAGVTLVSNSTDGCHYQTNSVMFHNAPVGVLAPLGDQGTSKWQQTSAGVPCTLAESPAMWNAATGMAYPTRFVLVSKGTPPSSSMYSQPITWSK
jgi:hypothetical protein